MSEYIFKVITDSDGIDCYIKCGEITRCKDCKWFRNCIEYKVCGISPIHHPFRFDNDFCSMGERRE